MAKKRQGNFGILAIIVFVLFVFSKCTGTKEPEKQAFTEPAATTTEQESSSKQKEEVPQQKAEIEQRIQCKVVGVSDGDTITCLTEQKEQLKIRLYQIDAPEGKQDFGQRSKKTLSDMVFGKQVKIESHGTDKYKRTLGTIFLDDMDVNLEMIKQGMAWVYIQYAKDKAYFDAEQQARNSGAGLWQQSNYIEPWEWRKGKRAPVNNVVEKAKKSQFSCGSKRYCKEMNSCAEAKFYLNECGVSRLDRDRDGIPCESICRR